MSACYADDVIGSIRICFDHPHRGRNWRIVKPADVVGYWHVESTVIVDRRKDWSTGEVRVTTQSFSLVLHDSEFERITR
jgi:hypothetical protein